MIKNDKKYLSERGRSITEMIAVVVSISVLTVLGLTLYWYVLNRQKTNALTGEVGSMALNTSIMLSQPDPNVQIRGNLEYPYTGTINDNKTFTITVSNIPGGICSLLKADKWSLPYETKFNGDIYGECQNENEIAFSFHNSLYDGAHPELEQEQEEPEQKINYCRPACRAGCKETCKTNQYWCWEDGCACLNGKANPPQCNQDPPCTQETVEIHDCEGNPVICCPDFYICEEPECTPGGGRTCTLNEDLSTGCTCPEHRDISDGKCGDCVNEEKNIPWNQPILTSNGTMGGENAFACAASTERGVRKAWRAFDNSNSDPETDCWHNNDDMPAWLSWYTPEKIKVNSVRITNRPGANSAISDGAVPKNFEIQYSDNRSSWITVFSGTNPQGPMLSTSFQVNENSAHNYWRIYITNTHVDDSMTTYAHEKRYLSIGEISISADKLQTIEYTLNPETLQCE